MKMQHTHTILRTRTRQILNISMMSDTSNLKGIGIHGHGRFEIRDTVVNVTEVVEDGYEFFARRQLVTLFSAPNYCGEFDNAGAMMTVDETLMCSFQILKPATDQQRRY